MGYLWHAINGATYGIAYTLLFGSGSWLLAFGWGTFVWSVMMASMPKMMPMVKLSYPKFMVIPLIAHLAMAMPISYFALSYVTPGASATSLLGASLNHKHNRSNQNPTEDALPQLNAFAIKLRKLVRLWLLANSLFFVNLHVLVSFGAAL